MLRKIRHHKRNNFQEKFNSFDELMHHTEKRKLEFDEKHVNVQSEAIDNGMKKLIELNRKTFVREFKKVVEEADVVLEILDARDPLSSRCSEVEDLVNSKAKKLVLILNKIDLIPRDNCMAWISYLQCQFPTIAFKASTQNQRDHLSHRNIQLSIATDRLVQSSPCIGGDVLMKLLANYCRGRDCAIRVGVVGYPNTGKSSIINSLKRTKACNVGATPGITRVMQEVTLDKKIKLIDSPGLILDKCCSSSSAVLWNAVRIDSVEDPILPVRIILSRCNKHELMSSYNVPDFETADEFLSFLAIRHGRLRKGGLPDSEKAAREVLNDWNHGKISYHTQPPEHPSVVSCEISNELRDAFDINTAVFGYNNMDVEPTAVNNNYNHKDVSTETTRHLHQDGSIVVLLRENSHKRPIIGSLGMDDDSHTSEKKNLLNDHFSAPVFSSITSNKDMKKAFKRMKKSRKRADVLAMKLSTAMDCAFEYGFSDADECINEGC